MQFFCYKDHDAQVSAAAKAAKSVAESHGMTPGMQLQLAVGP